METESGEVLGQASARMRDGASCEICDLFLTNIERGLVCRAGRYDTEKVISFCRGRRPCGCVTINTLRTGDANLRF